MITLDYLKDTFKIGYEQYEDSRREMSEVYNMYHNRQYTKQQLDTLSSRGQPVETFNVIKLFARMLIGYYSTVVNDIKVSAAQYDDIYTASILNDLISNIMRSNTFESEADKIKLDGILSGLMCSYINVEANGEYDPFGRPLYDVKINHVPVQEVVIDPSSRRDDYSDAKYIHRFKWLDEATVIRTWGKELTKKLSAYYNHLEQEDAEFEAYYSERFTGKYAQYDNYLIVHSIVIDEAGDSWSIFWCGDVELDRKKITYKKVKNPYRIQKINYSNKVEFYGIFREIVEIQKAINQAIIKIQLMVNTQKAFVEEGSVDNLEDFTRQFNRVNAVIQVKDLSGIKIENLTREVIDQYTVIDKALDRVQRILSINDSFLGMAYASDSGRKVQLQQNASIVALRYLTSKIENFYRLQGWDILNLIQQYYTAYQVIAVADSYEGQRWVELNRPVLRPTGRIDPNTGQPEMQPVYKEAIDPESGEPMVDDNGAIIMVPETEHETEIAFARTDIIVDSVAYNDEDEQNQQLLTNLINGSTGVFLQQINPAGFAKISSLAVKNTKSKYSAEIARVLDETAQMLSQAQQAPQQPMGGQPNQLPQGQ